jgi:hypothetical protein
MVSNWIILERSKKYDTHLLVRPEALAFQTDSQNFCVKVTTILHGIKNREDLLKEPVKKLSWKLS